MADPVLHGGAFIDGRDKVLRLKIKKLAAAAFEKLHRFEVACLETPISNT